MLVFNPAAPVQRSRNTRKLDNRHSLHRHADEYLAKLDKMKTELPIQKIKKTANLGYILLEHFARGLETMFGALHIKP